MSIINGLMTALKNPKVAAAVDFGVTKGKEGLSGLRTFGDRSFLKTSDMLDHLSTLGANVPGVETKTKAVMGAITAAENKILGATRGGGAFSGSSQYNAIPREEVIKRLNSSGGTRGPGSHRLPGSSGYSPQSANMMDAIGDMKVDRLTRRAEKARTRAVNAGKEKRIDKMLNDWDVSGSSGNSGRPYKEGSKVKTEPLGLKKGQHPVSDGFVGPTIPNQTAAEKAAGIASGALGGAKDVFKNASSMVRKFGENAWEHASIGKAAGHMLAGGATGGLISGLTTAVNYGLDGDKNQGPGLVKSIGMGMALGAGYHSGTAVAAGIGKSLTTANKAVTVGALAMATGGYAIAGKNAKTRPVN